MMRALRLSALAITLLWASSSGERLLRGDNIITQGSRSLASSANDPTQSVRKVSINDQAANITKEVPICKKKEETDCGIWNSVFHSTAFDCKDYPFEEAYDICKGLERHDYCGCVDDDDLLELVESFLEERRKKNWIRYYQQPYPPPR